MRNNGKEVFRICIISYRTHKVTLEHREGQFLHFLTCLRPPVFVLDRRFHWILMDEGNEPSLRESVLLRLVDCVVCCCLEFCTIKVTCKKCFYSNTKVFFFRVLRESLAPRHNVDRFLSIFFLLMICLCWAFHPLLGGGWWRSVLVVVVVAGSYRCTSRVEPNVLR